MDLRTQAEREIVEACIKSALRHGWDMRGVDLGGEGIETGHTTAWALEQVFSVDDARVLFHRGRENAWMYFVMGNDGWDVLNDYTVNLDDAIKRTEALVCMWEDRLS